MSLKADLQARVLKDMVQQHTQRGDEHVVLVVDPHAAKIISSCARVFDVMDAGVLALENITKQRERLVMPAIYFLKPCRESIEALVRDFEGKKPHYSRAHLYFTSRCPEELTQLLVNAPKLLDYLDVVTELECDFVAAESRVFVFNRRLALRSLLGLRANNPEDRQEEELRRTAQQLSSLCATMHEYPYIRFQAGSRLAARLAAMFERDLNELVSRRPKWQANPDRERGTLLIVDRSLDPVAPLMHEFTYQAMAGDLLRTSGEMMYVPSDEAKADEQGRREKEYVMSEDDAEWVRHRHEHIADVQTRVSRAFAEFRAQNAMAQLRGKDNKSDASLKEMIKAMKSLPQYQSIIHGMEKHMSVALSCMSAFDQQKLATLAELEQDIVTNVDENGDKVKQAALRERLARACTDKSISTENKMRLLMIYLAAQGDLGSSRRQLLDAAGVGPERARAMTNMRYLGVDVTKAQRPPDRRRQQEFADRARSNRLQFMRFVPALQGVLKELASDTLSREAYPYTKEPPPKPEASVSQQASGGGGNVSSLRRNRRNNWRDKKSDAEPSEAKEAEARAANGPHLITFVLGGLTYSEIRCAYEVTEERHANLTVGSTELLTPAAYLAALEGDPDEDDDDDLDDDLDDGQVGIKIDKL